MNGLEPSEERQPDTHSNDSGFIDKTGKLFIDFFKSPTRTTEALTAGILSQIEIIHDSQLFPDKWSRHGLPAESIGTSMIPENNPALRWAFDNIGDIWEIAVGFGAIRLSLFAVNGMLRQPETVGLQKKLLANDSIRSMANKIVGVEKTNDLAEGKEMQISDDACFWTSLATTFTVKAMHSMGWISLMGFHDHIDEPVPGMIFGQVVAATALAAAHYAAKNHESIKDLASRVTENTKSSIASLVNHFKNWQIRAQELDGSVKRGIVDHMNDLDNVVDYLDMERKVAQLMLRDWSDQQYERLTKIISGKIDGEG